jgi:rhamnogalacturonan endolyase
MRHHEETSPLRRKALTRCASPQGRGKIFLGAIICTLISGLAALGFFNPTGALGQTDRPGKDAILLDDDFSQLPPGMFSPGEVGAHAEYHYLPVLTPKGNWGVACFANGSRPQRCWRVLRDADASMMSQVYLMDSKKPECHPMLVTANLDGTLWRDYKVAVCFAPQSAERQSGFAFRYRNNRCYYFFGVVGPQAVLKLVRDATAYHKAYEKILAQQAFSWKPGELLRATVEVAGSRISARFENGPALQADDTTFSEGRVGLTSDVPVSYYRVTVTASPQEAQRLQVALGERNRQLTALRAANPRMKLWKKFEVGDYGVGRNLRFGDLDGDGRVDILFAQVKHHGPKNDNSEVSCLTAVNFDGKILWQVGQPDRYNDSMLTNDVAVQIHDLDGDGRNEVVYCTNQELIVADGATGTTKYKVPTPESPKGGKKAYNRFSRILGDSLFFCDLRGTGRRADVVLKDRYKFFWVYNDRLELLWNAACNTGHYPFAYDIDDDGKDELMMGYTLFRGDGKVLWSNEDELGDHADGVAIAKFRPNAPPRLLSASSDEGIFFADVQGQGKILKHHYLGHVQNPAIANFRDDLPGLEAVSINFWGNQGIVHLYDADGNVYHDFEPHQQGSMCLPINWTGKSEEFFVLSPNVQQGGLFDGHGRCVVQFPADGHPDLCYTVLDVTGDCRDEIVVWDPWELWVYTQSDNPKQGKLYKPARNPQCNSSNYQATISLPRWSEQGGTAGKP